MSESRRRSRASTTFFSDPLSRGRELKAALRSGETRVGAFLKIPSPDMVEVLAGGGLHFVIADAEHGPIGPETCQQMVRAADAAGMPLLVRVGESHSAPTVWRYLDTGVAGIHLPRVSSAEVAREQLRSIAYPPRGSRGLAGARWARYGKGGSLPDLARAASESLVVISQVEEVEAVADLDALLTLDEVDVHFLGPTDLASSMGLYGASGDSRVVDMVDDTLARIVAAGKTAGAIVTSPSAGRDLMLRGARYIVFNGESLVHWGIDTGVRGLFDSDNTI